VAQHDFDKFVVKLFLHMHFAADVTVLSNFAVGVAWRNESYQKSRLDFETLPASIF